MFGRAKDRVAPVLDADQHLGNPQVLGITDTVSAAVRHLQAKGRERSFVPQLMKRFQLHGLNIAKSEVFASLILTALNRAHLALTRSPTFSGVFLNEMIPFSDEQPR